MNSLQLMGILNITPDSFSDGGKYLELNEALKQFIYLSESGADIIDIGAESSRPSAVLIDQETEWQRLEKILKEINKLKLKTKISLDTYKGIIAQRALRENLVQIINDVSGLKDNLMLEVLREFPNCEIIINHNRGIPASRDNFAFDKENSLSEIIIFFENCLDKLESINFPRNQIILDLGLGIGKGLEENMFLIKNLGQFKKYFNLRILLGPSRKRFVKELWTETKLEIEDQSLDWASLVISSWAAFYGANIIRCHDINIYKPLKTLGLG